MMMWNVFWYVTGIYVLAFRMGLGNRHQRDLDEGERVKLRKIELVAALIWPITLLGYSVTLMVMLGEKVDDRDNARTKCSAWS